MQVENYRIAQGAGADFCPLREKRERSLPQQSPEQGLQPELGSKSVSHPFNVTPAGNEGETSPLGTGVWEHWQLARPKSKAK